MTRTELKTVIFGFLQDSGYVDLTDEELEELSGYLISRLEDENVLDIEEDPDEEEFLLSEEE